MKKKILVTGSTDGIGLATARQLVSMGHHVLLHGRNPAKLEETERSLATLPGGGRVESYLADLSRLADVVTLAKTITEHHNQLDVLINNAGIFRSSAPITQDQLDVRFAVNTFAPYLLMQHLMPVLGTSARVINLSSAAQSPVDIEALAGRIQLNDDFTVYAQSKLALTMWSRYTSLSLKDKGPMIVAINPGSMLGSKMVQEGFGVAGGDIAIGANILCRAALSDEFATASGLYFDNDIGKFAEPHPDALDIQKTEAVVEAIDHVLSEIAV